MIYHGTIYDFSNGIVLINASTSRVQSMRTQDNQNLGVYSNVGNGVICIWCRARL